MVHRLSITPVPEFAQRPWAKNKSASCCSLSLRERVRVRGKCSVERAKRRMSPRPPSAQPTTVATAQSAANETSNCFCFIMLERLRGGDGRRAPVAERVVSAGDRRGTVRLLGHGENPPGTRRDLDARDSASVRQSKTTRRRSTTTSPESTGSLAPGKWVRPPPAVVAALIA